ncbi:MAG TPA: extracellular solute-binding protein [Clostridia bacterium]|nr:extracellular solute-binding protein [Clostridia bacterium]HUM61214.1 extracellular solute-binding protein [Clostridia bacterium]
MPNVDDAVYVGGIGYRTDIFEAHGYQEPATVQEFYDLLVAIKKDTGLIPLTGRNAVEAVIASGFGLSYDFVVDPESDRIVSWLRDPGMKEYLAWMNKVYTEGLIDVDWPVNANDKINEKISSNQAVMTFAAHWHTLNWVNALVESGHKEAYFKTIVPLEDAQGKRHIAVSNGISRVFVVPVTASDEDAVYTMGMIASRLEPENYWTFNDGIEGTHYTKGEDGIPVPILPQFNDDMNQGSQYQIGRNQYEHPITWMARVHKTQVQWDTFYDANSKAAAFGFEGRPLTFARFPEYTEYYAALGTLCSDYFMQVIAGTETLDSYDDFVKEWESAGGLALEEAATAWYHENPELVNAARESTSPYNAIFGYDIK